jgi:hypothetical protein
VGGFTATDLQVAASACFQTVRQTQEIPSSPARLKTNWKMKTWLTFSDKATFPFKHLSPVTTVVSDSQNRDHVMDSEPDSREFDAFCVISCHKICRSFFSLQRNPSIIWLMHQLHEDTADFTLRQEVKSKSEQCTITTKDTMRFRISIGALGPPDHRILTLLLFIGLCEAHSTIYNKHLSTATQAHWSSGITIRDILLKV